MSTTSWSSEDDAAHHHQVLLFHQSQRRSECEALIAKEGPSTQGYCPTLWDDLLCWPKTLLNTTSVQSCPDYIPGLHTNGTASKHCTKDGDWYFHQEKNKTWTDYSNCYISSSAAAPPPHLIAPVQTSFNDSIIQEWLPIIKRISQVGYGVSFVTLLLAFFILVSIKKLRCPRNTLHMHLFLSFMLRAFMAILKDLLFRKGVGLSISILEGDEGLIFRHNQPNWECKLVTSLWQYFIVANYMWILMEGLYLHNLIFMAPFSDSSSITFYVLLGWGCPLAVVGSWVAARATLEDTYCWTTNWNKNLFLIIRIPIIVSIVLNFLFFLNIVRVLLLKLQSAVSIETRKYRYRKWAKSTLVLVPLFGVHYMLFLWMSSYVDQDPVIEVVWLFCDQLFASFQGFFVAILYCLINGEVRSELGKKWSNWRTDSESKNIWVPLNQISSKFYHRSTHEDLLAHNNGSECHQAANKSSCCSNPCSGSGSSRKGKKGHHYHPGENGIERNGRGGSRYRSELDPNSNNFVTQTEDHHLTINTVMTDGESVSSAFHHDNDVHCRLVPSASCTSSTYTTATTTTNCNKLSNIDITIGEDDMSEQEATTMHV